MKLFNVPYKWSRRPLQNIGHIWYDIHRGVRNLIRWFPLAWQDRDFDYAYLLRIMAYKFERMARSVGDNGVTISRERKGRELRIAAELCRRLDSDSCRYSESQLKYYESLLAILIRRHLRTWWD